MTFHSDAVRRVEVRVIIDEAAAVGRLVPGEGGGLAVGAAAVGEALDLSRAERWLEAAGLELVERQRRGRRWTLRARLADVDG